MHDDFVKCNVLIGESEDIEVVFLFMTLFCGQNTLYACGYLISIIIFITRWHSGKFVSGDRYHQNTELHHMDETTCSLL